MANIHGKNAIVYLGDGAGGAAISISEQNTYSIESDFELAETSELGDTWKSNVKGLMSWTASMEGNFNTASNQLFTAATGAQTANFYLYPDVASTSRYYYGTCWVKLGTVIAGGTGDKASAAVELIGDGALSKN